MSEKFVPRRIKISAGDIQAWIDKGYPFEKLVKGRAEQEEDKPMNKRHKHYETIVAWAEGKEIQFRRCGNPKWQDHDENIAPRFYDDYEYRIKPEPKPDVVREGFMSISHMIWHPSAGPNLRLTFSGEDGSLKSAEVIDE